MKCKKCGAELLPDDLFCGNCGSRADAQTEPIPQPKEQMQSVANDATAPADPADASQIASVQGVPDTRECDPLRASEAGALNLPDTTTLFGGSDLPMQDIWSSSGEDDVSDQTTKTFAPVGMHAPSPDDTWVLPDGALDEAAPSFPQEKMRAPDDTWVLPDNAFGASEQAFPQDDYASVQDDWGLPEEDDGYADWEQDAADDVPKKGGRSKVLVALLVVLIVAILAESVLAVLYLTDVTSSFFPVQEVMQWIKGEDPDKPEGEESSTQPAQDGQQSTTSTTVPVSTTASAQPSTTAAQPASTTAASTGGVPDNLQPYLNDSTAVNRSYVVNTARSNLNVRKLPDTNSDVVAEIPKATVVTVQYVYGSWGFVEFGGKSGWVSMQYMAEQN